MLCNQKMKKKIIDIIEETICNENEKILPTYKIKDLNIDSLDMYEIIMKIEEFTETEVNTEQFMKFETINDIIQFFEKTCKGDNKNEY